MPIAIDSLNPAQRQAATTIEGPLLVLAGAGSGKTRVLTYRIGHMIEDLGIAPWQILAITFTNKAAREMRERLDKLMDGRSTRGMWVCTFHAMCVRMLRIDGERLGYTNNFTIYDDDDSKRLMKSILADLRVDEKRFPLNAVRARISDAKNELMDPDELAATAQTPPDKIAAQAYAELQTRLTRANAMDFDDLLVNAYRLLRDNPDVLERYQDRFCYISVDEYQDTNRAQYQICKLLAAKNRNLMVVGDDDQSIYSWRGADIRNILDFEKDYPNATVVKLEQNYRSTGHILDAANAVVAHNTERKAKRLFTDAGDGEKIRLCLKRDELAEATYIAGEIKALRDQGVRYDEVAVFYRTNAQSRVLEDGLVKAGIPYSIVGGTRFFDRLEIRDLAAYLKLVVNPADDVSARRVINKPARSVGATTQERIAALAAERGISFFEAAGAYVVEEPGVASRTRNGIVQFLQVVGDAQAYEGSVDAVVELIAERSGLLDALRAENTDEARDRVENVREFFGVAKEYVLNHEVESELLSNDEVERELQGNAQVELDDDTPKAGDLTLAGFMEWLALRTDLDAAGDGDAAVTLMTVHAAKGLEFDTVFVAGMEEGVFPHVTGFNVDEAKLEEERRLAYVAITRARRRLYLTYAATRRLYGDVQTNRRSRFVDEIPAEHTASVGVGSEGFDGFGYDRRGSRHGIGGAGHGVQVYGGNVFGNRTRSSGGAGRGMSAAEALPGLTASRPAPAAPRTSFAAAETFAVGDRVSHKKFGMGTVTALKGDQITVHLDSGGEKTLLKGYAPIVKIKS
jgi:DNA helicase-2/ATP-dependent DNA helicase PcrA